MKWHEVESMIFRLFLRVFLEGILHSEYGLEIPIEMKVVGFPWLDVGSHGWMWVPMVGCGFPWLDV